jgi:hypothetical protein
MEWVGLGWVEEKEIRSELLGSLDEQRKRVVVEN